MDIKHDIYLISDSTGETIDRIFLALKAQFLNFQYNNHQFSFTRTQNQILKIIELAAIKKWLKDNVIEVEWEAERTRLWTPWTKR